MTEFVTCNSESIGPLIRALGLSGSTTSATIHLEAGELVRMTTERILTKYEVEELGDCLEGTFVRESASYTLLDGTRAGPEPTDFW
jgi:hypothetical protein